MMMEEFEKLTGFYPTSFLYEEIEKLYIECDEDKRKFCAAFKKNQNGMAQKAQRLAIDAYWKEHVEFENLKKRVKNLEKQLEIEQEWTPVSEMAFSSQFDYDCLKKSAGTRALSPGEAMDLAIDHGFKRWTFEIIYGLPIKEKSRHGELRIIRYEERPPLYFDDDWYYILLTTQDNNIYQINSGEVTRLY